MPLESLQWKVGLRELSEAYSGVPKILGAHVKARCNQDPGNRPFDKLRANGSLYVGGDERYAITPLRFTLEMDLVRK